MEKEAQFQENSQKSNMDLQKIIYAMLGSVGFQYDKINEASSELSFLRTGFSEESFLQFDPNKLPELYEFLNKIAKTEGHKSYFMGKLILYLCPTKPVNDDTIKTLCQKLEEKNFMLYGFDLGRENTQVTDEAFKYLKDIQFLSVGQCKKITSEGFKYLGQNKNLRTLRFNDCCPQISDEDLPYFKNIESLTFNFCDQITDTGLEYLGKNATNLKKLFIHGFCDGITDTGLEYLKDANLRALALTQCRNISIAGLKHFKNVERLNLYRCKQIAHNDLTALLDFPYLKTLKLPDEKAIEGHQNIRDFLNKKKLSRYDKSRDDTTKTRKLLKNSGWCIESLN